MHKGLALWLILVACHPALPRSDGGAQPTGAVFVQPANATAASDVPAATRSDALPSATGEPAASKLSPRLRLLANLAATDSLPADPGEQNRLLGLSESGAGSLSRDDAGNPIVDVRLLDTSDETIAALTALPAIVLSVAPEYATVTLAISPRRLVDLARLDAVQYVGEVIRPGGNPGPNPDALPGHGGVGPDPR